MCVKFKSIYHRAFYIEQIVSEHLDHLVTPFFYFCKIGFEDGLWYTTTVHNDVLVLCVEFSMNFNDNLDMYKLCETPCEFTHAIIWIFKIEVFIPHLKTMHYSNLTGIKVSGSRQSQIIKLEIKQTDHMLLSN